MAKDFTKVVAKEVSDRIMGLVKETLKKEFGYDVFLDNGSFNSNKLRLKIEIIKPMSEITKGVGKVDVEWLRAGLAPMGTPVRVFGRGPEKYTILKSNRTNYVISNEDGKQFVVPFTALIPVE